MRGLMHEQISKAIAKGLFLKKLEQRLASETLSPIEKKFLMAVASIYRSTPQTTDEIQNTPDMLGAVLVDAMVEMSRMWNMALATKDVEDWQLPALMNHVIFTDELFLFLEETEKRSHLLMLLTFLWLYEEEDELIEMREILYDAAESQKLLEMLIESYQEIAQLLHHILEVIKQEGELAQHARLWEELDVTSLFNAKGELREDVQVLITQLVANHENDYLSFLDKRDDRVVLDLLHLLVKELNALPKNITNEIISARSY